MKRNPIAIGAAGCVVILLAWYFLWFAPLGDDISKRSADRDAAQSEHDRLSGDIARLKDLARDEVNEKATLARFQAMAPNGAQLDGLIDQLNDVAQTAGLSWLSVTPSKPEVSTGGTPQPISITMNLTGRFQPLLDYLRGLAHMDRLIVVTGITLSSGAGSSETTDTATSSVTRITSDIDPELTVVLTTKAFVGSESSASLVQAQSEASGLSGTSTSSTSVAAETSVSSSSVGGR